MTTLEHAREMIADAAHSLHARGLTHGSTGNISVRIGEQVLVTPTGSSLGTVTPEQLSLVTLDGTHLDGGEPSKETFLHLAVLRARPQTSSVVHTHSTHAAALSCLDHTDPSNTLPPYTAYFAMRVGKLPLLPYHAPGDTSLEMLAESVAASSSAFLLSNHGPVLAAGSLSGAVDAAEELEETARLFFLLRGMNVNPVPPEEVDRLHSLHGQ